MTIRISITLSLSSNTIIDACGLETPNDIETVSVHGAWDNYTPNQLFLASSEPTWTTTIEVSAGQHSYFFRLNGRVNFHDKDKPSQKATLNRRVNILEIQLESPTNLSISIPDSQITPDTSPSTDFEDSPTEGLDSPSDA